MEEAIKSLPYFKQSDNYITAIEKLSGGQQNINFKVTNTKGQKYVCRIPGVDAFEHGQIHETVYKNMVAAHGKQGIAPRPTYFDEVSGIIVTEYVESETLSISMLHERPNLLDKVITAIRCIHNNSDPATELVPSKASDVLFGYNISLLNGWCTKGDLEKTQELQTLLKCSLGCFGALVGCHNDLVPANFLVTPNDKILVIDWEWSGPGDRICDLATFCGLSGQDSKGEKHVLSKYLEVDEPLALDQARLRLWRIWFTLRGGLWALCKAKSVHFANRNASEITEDDDYDMFSKMWIEEFITMINESNTNRHMDILKKAVDITRGS